MVGKEISLDNLKKETKTNRTTVKSKRKYTYQYFLKIMMKDKGFAKH